MLSWPVASRSSSCHRPGVLPSRIGFSRSSFGSSDQTSGTNQSTGAPTVTGQDTAAVVLPAPRSASQRVPTWIADSCQYQRPVCPAGSKGWL